MKTIIAISAFAFLVATSAFGKIAKVPTSHVGPYDIYQSHSLGQQSFPNPDRDFTGPNVYHSAE